ncbi:MAG: hypothetical protein CBD16_06535 [Betaproteobacteria bacterium TMED156]|nr:MAG: hypothetical protein CBD16_06535 [Betaproteobacteria bacterium TMED156]
MSARKKQFFSSISVTFMATIIGALLTINFTFLKKLEIAAKDIRVTALQPPEEQSKDIVIATINEETVAMFPYRSPVDREFLANLIKILEIKGAKAVGIDILLDSPTEPKKDLMLKEAIKNSKIPLFASYTNTPEIVNEEQLAYLNEFVPKDKRAAANFATDPFDGTVRWIYPGEDKTGMPLSFPRKAAEISGIKTSNEENISIAWRPKLNPETPAFPEYPAHALGVLPAEWFENKIVLVGAKLSLEDRHRTPFSLIDDGWEGRMPGAIIHAHATSQLLENRQPFEITDNSTFLICLLMALIGMGIGLAKKGIFFSVIGGLISTTLLWVISFVGFPYGLPMIPLVAPTITLALSLWMMDLIIGKAERQQRKFVQGAFSRYVAPAVVDKLVENPESLIVKGVKQQTTFIFSDIAGFTTLSENLSSEKLSTVLNEYLDGACKIVFQHGGTIDKFIGDAIMAVFNAPIKQADHIERAVNCALDLDTYCEKFRINQINLGVPLGITRIGVHTGIATVGNFGSQSRMDFTALGDTVNTAARTESVNKYFGTRIAATQEIVSSCNGLFFLPIGDIVLKGKSVPVTLFNPVNEKFYKSDFSKRYLESYEALKCENQEISKNEIESTILKSRAANLMLKLFDDFPEESLPKFHVNRIKKGFLTTLVVMEDK